METKDQKNIMEIAYKRPFVLKTLPEKNKGGRPKGKATKHEERSHIVKRISKAKDEIIKAQIAAAIGMHYFDAEKGIVFTQKPNVGTGEYLLNQLIGKPKESMEITDERQLNVDL